MDKFWKWMEEKGYDELYDDYGSLIMVQDDNKLELDISCPSEGIGATHKLPKQMLIGYKIEYLNDKDNLAKLSKKRLLNSFYQINEHEDIDFQLNLLIEEINND